MNRGNGKFDDFEEGDERIYFAIDPEVVARVTSMDGEYFEWRLSDLDKIDKTLLVYIMFQQHPGNPQMSNV